jgi:integrase
VLRGNFRLTRANLLKAEQLEEKSCRQVIQRILRHSTVATTQNHYIKTAPPDAIAAMKQFSEALLCCTFAPDGDVKAKGSVQ